MTRHADAPNEFSPLQDSVDVEGVSEEFAYLCLKFKPVVAHQEVYRSVGWIPVQSPKF